MIAGTILGFEDPTNVTNKTGVAWTNLKHVSIVDGNTLLVDIDSPGDASLLADVKAMTMSTFAVYASLLIARCYQNNIQTHIHY